MKKSVALYFGSFNPIHLGHLIVAEHFCQLEGIDEVWLVVSPHNPLKEAKDLAPAQHRLAMVQLAIKDNPKLQACDLEFQLPTPSYTCETLKSLKGLFAGITFSLLIGEDQLPIFHRWKEYEFILSSYSIYVYPRFHSAGNDPGVISWDNYTVIRESAPRIEISSTEIRRCIAENKSIRYRVPEVVRSYMELNSLYS